MCVCKRYTHTQIYAHIHTQTCIHYFGTHNTGCKPSPVQYHAYSFACRPFHRPRAPFLRALRAPPVPPPAPPVHNPHLLISSDLGVDEQFRSRMREFPRPSHMHDFLAYLSPPSASSTQPLDHGCRSAFLQIAVCVSARAYLATRLDSTTAHGHCMRIRCALPSAGKPQYTGPCSPFRPPACLPRSLGPLVFQSKRIWFYATVLVYGGQTRILRCEVVEGGTERGTRQLLNEAKI